MPDAVPYCAYVTYENSLYPPAEKINTAGAVGVDFPAFDFK